MSFHFLYTILFADFRLLKKPASFSSSTLQLSSDSIHIFMLFLISFILNSNYFINSLSSEITQCRLLQPVKEPESFFPCKKKFSSMRKPIDYRACSLNLHLFSHFLSAHSCLKSSFALNTCRSKQSV